MDTKFKQNPFKVPQNYFDETKLNLSKSITQRHNKTKVISLKSGLKIAVAGSVLMFIVWQINTNLKKSTYISNNNLIIQDINQFDDLILAEEVTNQDIVELINISENNTDAQIDYLLQADVEMEEILAEY